MKKLSQWITILTLGFVICSPSFGSVNQKLQQYFRNELQTLNKSLTDGNSTSHGIAASTPEEAWMLSTFMIRIRPKFGFEIPELASFFVIPEAELVWQQSMPEGWAPYKPAPAK